MPKPRFVIRLFTPFSYSTKDVRRLLSHDFIEQNGVEFFVNESGACDAAFVLGYAKIGSWVQCPKGNLYKAVVEPWQPGLFNRFVRKHGRKFEWIYTPHVAIDRDPRVRLLVGNLDWHVQISHDELAQMKPPVKTKRISAVASTKNHMEGHKMRLKLLNKIERDLEELDRFGRGTQRPIGRKEEGLMDYKYSIAIENSQQDNYITEKFYDSILTWTVPIYVGAPNIQSHFPLKSFIALSPDQFDNPTEAIIEILKNDIYSERLSDIEEARTLILRQHTLQKAFSEIILTARTQEITHRFRLDTVDSYLHGTRDKLKNVLVGLKNAFDKGN